MTEIKFDEATHTYKLDGVRLPSVTQILSDVGIIVKGPYFNEKTSSRGSAVHKATAMHDEGIDFGGLHPDLKGYLKAWVKFRNENPDLEMIEIEKKQAHEVLRFAGTPDRLALKDKTYWVIDIKTGVKTEWHKLQTAGYSEFYSFPVARASVYLSDNGKYKMVKHLEKADLAAWRSVLSVFNWKRNAGMKEA